jgi:phosphatidylinositol-3-phosphatase
MRYHMKDAADKALRCMIAIAVTAVIGMIFDFVRPNAAMADTNTTSAAADAHVYSGVKTANYGSVTPLQVNGSSYRTLLRFDTTAVPMDSTITSVTLRLYTVNATSSGAIRVHPSSSTWNEALVNWNTQPTWNTSVLASSGLAKKNTWLAVSLPPASINPASVTSFGLDYSATGTMVKIASRESGATAPQVVVSYTPRVVQDPPVAATEPATDITAVGALLHGTAQDRGATTSCSFEYGTSSAYGTTTPSQIVAAGTGSQNLSASLGNLQPGTEYSYRLKCANSGGTAVGDNATFTTAATAPTVITKPATDTTDISASLQGLVKINGDTATCTFEYGPTAEYGTTTPEQIVSAAGEQSVSAVISNLTSGTVYNYRFVCGNALGVTYGDNVTFTAATPPPPPTGVTKVLWIMEENRSETQLMTTSYNPYMQSLASTYGLLANLHNETDPSSGNYAALLSGDTHGIADDSLPARHPLTGPTIFSQVPAGQAMAFSETMPGNCYTTDGPATDINHEGMYSVHHSGWPYFVDANERALCQQYHVNLQSNLQAKIDSGLPSFTQVAPANCNEMHRGTAPGYPNGCAFDAVTGSSLYSRADWWMSTWLPKIMAGPDYKAGKLAIMIVWDEGAGPGDTAGMDCTTSTIEACHPPAIIISPYTHSVISNFHYTHYDILRTTEELLGVQTYLGHAAQATSFATEFGLNGGQ